MYKAYPQWSLNMNSPAAKTQKTQNKKAPKLESLDYHEITVRRTDGSTFKTRSTYGKAGDTLILDIDPLTHPAWTGGGAILNQKAGKVAKFANKYGSIGQKKEQ
jgi:large subunit ribosomal protein L31